MNRKPSRLRWVRLRDIAPGEPGDLWSLPVDARVKDLLRRAHAGDVPMTRATARLADLEVHHPPTLQKVRASLHEEPSIRNSMALVLLNERPPFLVYRNDAGRLVMFDDYVKYAVAQGMGLKDVRVDIIEGHP